MSDPGRNAAGVSTAYVKALRPASEDSISDDPPPYSACVPYPPTIYLNYPATRSSLLDNPPAYPGREIRNGGIQTGNYLQEGRPSAPFLDVPSTSGNPPAVHEPRVTPYNGQPERKPSCAAIQGNPPTYRHEQKTIHIRRSSGTTPRNRFVGLCTAILVGITISTIVIAGMRSHFNKTRKTHYHDIPDICEETKIKPVYKDDSHGKFDFGDGTKINFLDFDKMRRAMNEHIHKIFNFARRGKNNETYRDNDVDRSLGDNVIDMIRKYAQKDFAVKTGKVDVDADMGDVTDCTSEECKNEEDDEDSPEPNFEPEYPNLPDVLNARSSKFGDQRSDDDTRAMNFKRIADRFEDILGIPRKERTNESVVGTPASDHDS